MATMESIAKSFKGSLFSGLELHEEWTRRAVAPIKSKRRSFKAVALDDGYRILVVGGDSADGGGLLNSVEVYDSRTNQWTSEGWPDLKVSRRGFAATLCNGKVYVVGGNDSIECLDLHSLPLEWKVLEHRLSIARSHCCAVGVGKFVYVMGGGKKAISLDSVEILDTDTGLISEGPSLTTPRKFAGAALVDNTIWVVGGCTNIFDGLDTVETHNVDLLETGRLLESSWTLCPTTMPTLRRWCPAVVSIGQSLVVMGGTELESAIEIFDTQRSEWWGLPATINDSFGEVAVTLEDSCIVAVGIETAEQGNTVESLSFTHTSSKVPSLAHLSELAIMERLPEFGSVTALLDWAEEHNAVHLKKACLALIEE
jgi:kelch-like protein 20